MPADLDSLRHDFPDWTFTTTWVTITSEANTRTILAKRCSDGVLVGGCCEHEVRRQITREEDLVPGQKASASEAPGQASTG